MFNVLISFLKYIEFIEQRNAKMNKKGFESESEDNEEKLVNPRDVLEEFLKNGQDSRAKGKLNKKIFDEGAFSEEEEEEDFEDYTSDDELDSFHSDEDDDDDFIMPPDEVFLTLFLKFYNR